MRTFAHGKGESMLIIAWEDSSDDMSDENPTGGGSDPTK